MLRERLTIWITLIATSLGGVAYTTNHLQIAFFVLLLPVAVQLLYRIHVRRNTKRIMSLTPDAISTSTQHIAGADLKKLFEQREAIQRIITAIDSIGNESHHDESLYINGEAGEAIKHLRDKLTDLREGERQRGWEAQGIAAINDIRKTNADLDGYANLVISQLAKFLKASLGSFYSLNHEDQFELKAGYAFGHHKTSTKKVMVERGNGLLGQCVEERKMIFLPNVPSGYTKIKSGLGEATPTCIAIVPLMFREEVYGILEIATFEFLEPYQLEFLTKVCEAIGLELYNIRTQERTRRMMEQSREEELRQNLEEMKATQREMLIKEEELNKQLITTQRAMAMAESERKKNEAILEGCMDAVISFNDLGKVEYFNKAAEEVFGIDRQQIIGNQVSTLLNISIDTTHDGAIRIVSNSGTEVTLRTEVNATDRSGEEISLLLTATKVKTDTSYLFTLFAQKVSVELF